MRNEYFIHVDAAGWLSSKCLLVMNAIHYLVSSIVPLLFPAFCILMSHRFHFVGSLSIIVIRYSIMKQQIHFELDLLNYSSLSIQLSSASVSNYYISLWQLCELCISFVIWVRLKNSIGDKRGARLVRNKRGGCGRGAVYERPYSTRLRWEM